MVRNGRIGTILNVIHAKETTVIQEIAVKENRLGILFLFALDDIHGYKSNKSISRNDLRLGT